MIDASLRYANYTDAQLAGAAASMQARCTQYTPQVNEGMRLSLVAMQKEQAARVARTCES